MTRAKITKMEVVTPERVFKGSEEDRWALPRNEGPEIVLHFAPEAFAGVAAKIKELPIQGINEKLYLPVGSDNNDNWGTLFHDDGFVIDAYIGKIPNTLVIVKMQEDPQGNRWITHNEQYGARGTRAISSCDVPHISYGLENLLNIDVPSKFESELEAGIAKAQPKHGYVAGKVVDIPDSTFKMQLRTGNRYEDYHDMPGTNHSVSF